MTSTYLFFIPILAYLFSFYQTLTNIISLKNKKQYFVNRLFQ